MALLLFKTGKVAVKVYDGFNLDKTVYIKVGKHMLDVDQKMITYLDDDNHNPIYIRANIARQIYASLSIDYKRDQKVPLTLDKNGKFTRTDGVIGFTSIPEVFASY